MKTILDTIVEHKRMEILKRKGKKPLHLLESMDLFERIPVDPLPGLQENGPSFIAEFKRRSPSKGRINAEASVEWVVEGYMSAGAAACSVLTDRDFFGGSFRDLSSAKKAVPGVPLLRKDFIIDPYQVIEAKAYGADMILLIAGILDRVSVAELSGLASSLGMKVLLEVHNRKELDSWNPAIDMVGVNNRDLRDFSVDISRSLELAGAMPTEVTRISESGLGDPETILQLSRAGFHGFLVGESFMKEANPGEALKKLKEKLKTQK